MKTGLADLMMDGADWSLSTKNWVMNIEEWMGPITAIR